MADKLVYKDLKEQSYIIKNTKSFEPKHIFECGQCFRWNKDENGDYIGVIKDGVLKVKKQGNDIIITGVLLDNANIENVCNRYFDLRNDYDKIKLQLSKIDDNLKNSINLWKKTKMCHCHPVDL